MRLRNSEGEGERDRRTDGRTEVVRVPLLIILIARSKVARGGDLGVAVAAAAEGGGRPMRVEGRIGRPMVVRERTAPRERGNNSAILGEIPDRKSGPANPTGARAGREGRGARRARQRPPATKSRTSPPDRPPSPRSAARRKAEGRGESVAGAPWPNGGTPGGSPPAPPTPSCRVI